MKIKKIILGALAVAMLTTNVACESMDEANVDPTRMSQATPGSFLNPTLYGMATYNWNRYNDWTFAIMQGIVSTSSTSGIGWFHIGDDAGSGTWSTYYKWLNNAKTIYNYGLQTDKKNYQAIGLTLEAWIVELVTEAFGDVPVAEACMGDSGVYYPRFDTQVEAFRTVLDDLARANALFTPAEGLAYNTNGDMLYCASGTDKEGIANWRRMANSLRLRCLLRVLNVDGLNARGEIQAMLADPETWPLIESNEQNADVHVSGVAPEEQPMPRLSDLTSYRVFSEFFIDRLKAWNDPRLAVWATRVTNNGVEDFYGLPSGYAVLPSMEASQPRAATIAQAPMDLQVISYAEVELIKAELAWRGIIGGSAKDYYERGVRASMEQWGAEVPENYFDNAAAAYDGTLERIMEQKFYALFFVDYQQWFEYNRTGFPEVPIGPGVDPGDALPRRFKYPTILQRTNFDNYQKAVEAMGGDRLDQRLVWQK